MDGEPGTGGNCWVECSQASCWNVLHGGEMEASRCGKITVFSKLLPDASHQIMLWKNCFCYNVSLDTSDIQ